MDAPPLWRCTLMTLVKKYDRLVESELCSASSDKNSSVPGRFLNIGYPKPTDDRKKPDLHVSPSTDILIEKNRERLATGQSENEIGSSMPIHKNSFRWLLPRAPQRRLVYKNGGVASSTATPPRVQKRRMQRISNKYQQTGQTVSSRYLYNVSRH